MPSKKRRRRPSLPASTLRCLELVGSDTLLSAQKAIGRRFKTPALLAQALVHSSCHVEVSGKVFIQCNEKLEQFGDKVVGLSVCRYLHQRYPQFDENFFAPIIGKAASNIMLDRCAKDAGLRDMLVANRTSQGLRDIQGWTKVWADLFEAVAAALYFDGDSRAVDKFFAAHLYPKVDQLVEEVLNPQEKVLVRPKVTGKLHDHMARHGMGSPRYELEAKGAGYTASIFDRANKRIGSGAGPSQGEARRAAAEHALRALEASPAPVPEADAPKLNPAALDHLPTTIAASEEEPRG